MKFGIGYLFYLSLVLPIYSSYHTECDVGVEILENLDTEISKEENSKCTYITLKVKIFSESYKNCVRLREEDAFMNIMLFVPFEKVKYLKLGIKIEVHYSYSDYNSGIRAVRWKFKELIQ